MKYSQTDLSDTFAQLNTKKLLTMRTRIMFHFLLLIAINVSSFEALKASERTDTIRDTNDTISLPKNADNPDILTPYHLSVIKFNPTPMMLFNELRNVTFSYERLIKKNKSVSFSLATWLFHRF